MLKLFRRTGLTGWIVIAMIIGIGLGALDFYVWHDAVISPIAQPLANLFLRLIKSIVVPLVFASLVGGIAGHGDDLKKVGRLAIRSLVYFEVVTTIALGIGLLAVNVVRPGAGVDMSTATADAGEQLATTHTTFSSVLEHTVPQSFFKAAADNEVLQVVFFAVLFGIALVQAPSGRGKEVVLRFFEGISEVMFKFTGLVMYFAPIGIGAALVGTISLHGVGVLVSLLKLVATLYGALVVFILLVLVPIAIWARVPVRAFWKWVKEPWLIAFSTASSEAALPVAMENLEKFGVPKRIVAFVLPTGYSFNLDGSTLYLAVASVFVAQAAGIDMSIGTQLTMMLTLMLTSKGVAAVPRASLVILSGVLASFHLPLQGVAVILGVDAVMDMARTSINLVGNCLASAVMGRWEGEYTPDSDFDPKRIAA